MQWSFGSETHASRTEPVQRSHDPYHPRWSGGLAGLALGGLFTAFCHAVNASYLGGVAVVLAGVCLGAAGGRARGAALGGWLAVILIVFASVVAGSTVGTVLAVVAGAFLGARLGRQSSREDRS